MEIIIAILLVSLVLLGNALMYIIMRYKKLVDKYEIVVQELCEYLDDKAQEESEWGNRR